MTENIAPTIRITDQALSGPVCVGASAGVDWTNLFSLDFLAVDRTSAPENFAVVRRVFLTQDAVEGVLNALNTTYNQWKLERGID